MAIIDMFECDDFSISHSVDTNPVDNHFDYHIHDSYEFFCLVRGKVGYIVEGRTYKLKPGAVLLMRKGEAHKLIVNESEEYERYVLNFRPELFSAFSPALLTPYTNRALGTANLYLPQVLDVSAISMFEKVFKEAPIIGVRDAVTINIASLLASIGIAFSNSEIKHPRIENELGDAIISYINENLLSELSLKSISSAIHISPSQINRIFKRISGTSVYDYILSKRLILFQEKFLGGMSAFEASQECGFRDYSSFYRLYKKRFGIAPTRQK
jgi:AraC-like DNA-binding protein